MHIVIYTKPGCIQCEWTQKQFDKMELTYLTIDITRDKDAERDVMAASAELGSTTMPYVVVSNSVRTERWFGFKLDKIRSLRVETGDY